MDKYIYSMCKSRGGGKGGGGCRWNPNERSLKIHPAVTGPPFGRQWWGGGGGGGTTIIIKAWGPNQK
jgi:hypothetical protein